MNLTPNLALVAGLAGIAALGALGVVLSRNAVRSALCLVLNFAILAVLYFTLNAEMLGVTQIVVYTGAIMVLFLFVIMLLNIGGIQFVQEKWDYRRPVAILLGLSLFLLLCSQVLVSLAGKTSVNALPTYGGPQAVGRTLFTDYAMPFESVSVLLLVGIVGSILLAKRRI